MSVLQGEIYWVDIPYSEIRGHEQAGRRPFIIVSRDSVNKAVKTVIGVPMSTTIANQPAFRIAIPASEITKDVLYQGHIAPHSVAKTDQARILDQSRLEQKMGRLSHKATLAVTLGLAWVLNIQ